MTRHRFLQLLAAVPILGIPFRQPDSIKLMPRSITAGSDGMYFRCGHTRCYLQPGATMHLPDGGYFVRHLDGEREWHLELA